jgi:hypothetical protein
MRSDKQIYIKSMECYKLNHHASDPVTYVKTKISQAHMKRLLD